MKKILIITLMVLCAFLLQSSVFSYLEFAGIIPNIMIILTASFGFMRGEKTGLLVGFFCGLLSDIFFGPVIGLYSLIYMYIGFLNGLFSRLFYPHDIKLPLVLISFSDLLYSFTCYFIFFVLRSRFAFEYYFLHIILPELFYTILVTLVLYPVILFINNRLDPKEVKGSDIDFV
ncbi:MAG: rod shape-determining protein MreD [Lachnospiraceae bacterium]|nr:rod shape-determining protein MreD [Lachnospiraceae bacterium]